MITRELPQETGLLTRESDQPTCPNCSSPRSSILLTAPDRFYGRKDLYQLMRCSGCSLVWLNDPPTPVEMARHYGPEYDHIIAAGAQAPTHWLPRRNELLRHKSGGAVLDLGCGSGGFLSTLKDPSWKLSGIEMSEDAAKIARNRCGAEVFVGDILDAPFSPGSFDAITCFNVLEHVYQPKDVLARISKWLKPGGVFYMMVPNIDSAGASIFRSYWYPLELPRHLFHYSPATLKMLARSSGLQEVYVRTHHELYFEASAYYIVGEILSRLGISRPPLSQAPMLGIPMRLVRKAFRLTILPLITAAAALAGDGETISAVFTKDSSSH